MRITRTASLQPLKNRAIAILGYGSQGRAQALNLRDAGLAATIGLPGRSRSRQRAKADGFTVTTPAQAAGIADILFFLIPDHVHGMVFENDIRAHLRPSQMLVFAHASSVHFKLVKPPPFVDVVLIAPLGPGKRLRELNAQAGGVPCFFAIEQDASHHARRIGLALARAIGCLPAGAIETTFAEEAVGDLFGEQAVLCGGLGELLKPGAGCLNLCGRDFNRGPLEADNPVPAQRDSSLAKSQVTSSICTGDLLPSGRARALDHFHSVA